MTVESAVWPDDLEPANPAATDLVNEGDDHMRLIKQVLQNWAGTTYGGQAIADSVAADIAALQAILQPQIDQNADDILTKADTDGAALTNVTIDGAEPVTDANYQALPVVLNADSTQTFPQASGSFVAQGGAVTLAGTAEIGNRLDIFNTNSSFDIDVSGLGNFTGFGSIGPTLTIPGGFGATIIWNGTGWYVIGAGSIG